MCANRLSKLTLAESTTPPCPAAAGAMSALQAKRDGVARRAEGLLKCKNDFAELAKCL